MDEQLREALDNDIEFTASARTDGFFTVIRIKSSNKTIYEQKWDSLDSALQDLFRRSKEITGK